MIHIRKSKDGQFYLSITGNNGEKILTSEMYTTKSSAKRSANALIKLFVNGTGQPEIIDHTKNTK